MSHECCECVERLSGLNAGLTKDFNAMLVANSKAEAALQAAQQEVVCERNVRLVAEQYLQEAKEEIAYLKRRVAEREEPIAKLTKMSHDDRQEIAGLKEQNRRKDEALTLIVGATTGPFAPGFVAMGGILDAVHGVAQDALSPVESAPDKTPLGHKFIPCPGCQEAGVLDDANHCQLCGKLRAPHSASPLATESKPEADAEKRLLDFFEARLAELTPKERDRALAAVERISVERTETGHSMAGALMTWAITFAAPSPDTRAAQEKE